jgi:hypothetical protein
MTFATYDASKILAIAANCLTHSLVSLFNLSRPRGVSEYYFVRRLFSVAFHSPLNSSRTLQSLKSDEQRPWIYAENAFAHLFDPEVIPYPRIGSSASVFKMSMSGVP